MKGLKKNTKKHAASGGPPGALRGPRGGAPWTPDCPTGGAFVRSGALLVALVMLLTAFNLRAEHPVVRAMKDEMGRSMSSLKLEKMEKPYFLEYTIIDHQEWTIEAGFGSLLKSADSRTRMLKTGMRVGDYQADNTAFLDAYSIQDVLQDVSYLVVDDDYDVLRRALWLETDGLYKKSLEQLAGKKAFLRNQVRKEELPDFSKEKPLQLRLPARKVKVDADKWEGVVKRLSVIFKEFPSIQVSRVEFWASVDYLYYVNSEGTVTAQPQTLAVLTAYASSQAADGMILKHHVPFYAVAPWALPGEKVLAEEVRKMAGELEALVKAPVSDEYIGPVIFTRQAAAELFAQMVVPQLSGERPPLTDMEYLNPWIASSKWERRLNRRVLPEFFSISDDPTIKGYKGRFLLGGYEVDQQGVKPGPMVLVEKGKLKRLLMSRRPRKEIEHSNGRGRAGLWGRTVVQAGNVLVSVEKETSYRELREQLLKLCRDQQLEYGIIIKSLDDPQLSGPSQGTQKTGDASPVLRLTGPVVMVRVYVEDGREELVRGVELSDFSIKDFRYIYGASGDDYVHHRMLPAGGSLNPYLKFSFSSGRYYKYGIPGSLVVPSVLFEELEFRRVSGNRKRLPLLRRPLAR